jgi:hypothetical protein
VDVPDAALAESPAAVRSVAGLAELNIEAVQPLGVELGEPQFAEAGLELALNQATVVIDGVRGDRSAAGLPPGQPGVQQLGTVRAAEPRCRP